MLSLTYESKANLFTNGASLFILAGMLANTSLYRRRGRSGDRLFFALIITDMAAAVSCCVGIWFLETGVALPSVLYSLLFTAFFSIYAVFGVLWCMYLMFRLGRNKAEVRKKLPRICIPAAVIVLLYLSDIFTGFTDSEGVKLGELRISPFAVFSLAPIIIYGIITVAMTFARHKRICFLYVLLILVNAFFLMVLDVDVTPLILSIYLIYAHLFAMRDPFYKEESLL